jgi:nicotinate-nucleotide adenylyltransferase
VAVGPLRLGILGGAFDPPHVGHVALARAAIDHFRLERLLVLVVEDPGHKRTDTPADVRLELARLAFADVPEAEIELDRHARTVDSLEARKPEVAVFLIGGDELADLPDWKRPERVLELVRIGVAMRPGVPESQLRAARARLPAPGRIEYFELEPVPVSSTEIRSRVAREDAIDGLVPPLVADAIARLGLYGAREYTAREGERTQTD